MTTAPDYRMFSFGIRAHASNDEHQRVLNIDVSKQILQVISKEQVEVVHALAYILCVVPNIRDPTAFAIYFKNGVAPLKCWAESSKMLWNCVICCRGYPSTIF
jgi:hypothetical protein